VPLECELGWDIRRRLPEERAIKVVRENLIRPGEGEYSGIKRSLVDDEFRRVAQLEFKRLHYTSLCGIDKYRTAKVCSSAWVCWNVCDDA